MAGIGSREKSRADLLGEAAAAARAGDRRDAERLYRTLLERSDTDVEAFLGLGGVVTDAGEKAACFRRVLAIDPDHAEARQVLARIGAAGAAAANGATSCAFHPRRPTRLRCGQCERPICPRCAHEHVVGHLCKVCRSGRRHRLRRPGLTHVAPAALAAGGVAAMVALIAGPLAASSILLAFLGGPVVGSMLGGAAHFAGRGRSGPPMQVAVGAAIVAGTLGGMSWWHPDVFSIEHGFVWSSGGFVLYLVLAVLTAVGIVR